MLVTLLFSVLLVVMWTMVSLCSSGVYYFTVAKEYSRATSLFFFGMMFFLGAVVSYSVLFFE